MSGLLNNSSLNRSSSNLQDNISAQPFSSSFSAQSGAPSPVFQHSGSMQGLHNIHGSFNVPNMQGTLGSRNSSMGNVPSSGLQQPTGSGRFTSNIPVALSQMNSHGHPGLTNRGNMGVVGNPGFSSGTNAVGGSIPGILPTSAAIGNRNAVGVSTLLGNSGPRIASSAGNIIGGGGNVGRSINTGGGLSLPGLSSRLNLNSNNGSGNVGMQGSNRLMGGMLQQASPQMMSMLGNSYHSGGPLSQNHVNSLNSMGMMNDVSNNNDGSPFDLNDFPQLSSRPSSSGGAQGQIGSMRKQGLGVSPIVQQNQEFSIQNEDFPALPGFKGGNADYGMDLHQKEQLHDNNVSMMQSPHFPQMGRSSGFNLGGTFSSHRPQQQNNQDLHHLHGSDMFQPSNSSYHSQGSGLGLRPINSQNTISGIGSYDQFIQQQYPPQQQNQSQFRLQQLSNTTTYRDQQGMKPMPAGSPDRFGLLGLLSVIRMSDPDLTSIALGIDLTTLGLNLNSAENRHRTFGSPWSDEPVKGDGDPDFTVPQCYYAKQPPVLNQRYFSKFQLNTLFYIFYSMPKDEAQLYAANELYNRGWVYHRDHRLWFMKVANVEPLVKTNAYERGSFICFDPNTWETIRKDNFVVYYEMLEKRPVVPQH